MKSKSDMSAGLLKNWAAVCLFLLLCPAVSFVSMAVPRPAADPVAGKLPGAVPDMAPEEKIFWHEDMDTAFALAIAEHKPVLVLFSSPDCSWCTKLKSEVLADKEVRTFLQHYRLVDIDILKNEEKAEKYMVRGVPTLLVFSSDGQIIEGVSGYINAGTLAEMLKKSLNPEFLKKIDASYIDILDKLAANRLPPELWPDVMISLGSRDKRKELHDRIMLLSPFPKKEIAGLLDSGSLAVRLGAIDILEEVAGGTFGFDPWLPAKAQGNDGAREKWRNWSEDENTHIKMHNALAPDQISSYIRDLISDDREVSSRALRMLENGGRDVYACLSDFIRKNPGLAEGKKNKIRVAQYSLIIPAACSAEPAALASGLVFGTVDVKLKNISRLQYGGGKVIAILKDFLSDSDSMIREAVVDALAVAGGKSAVQIYADFLPGEKDVNVVYAVLRNLGNIRTLKSVDILSAYLANQNEDIVIAALGSIAKIKSKKPETEIAKCLEDPRWRVRVAALDAVSGLGLKGLEEKVAALIDDKDEFVRISAIKALTSLASKKAAKKLEDAFLKDDQLKGPVAAAFCRMDLPFPESFAKALQNKNPDTIISVLQSMEDCKETEIAFADKFTENPNKDIAFTAARLLAVKGVKYKICRVRLSKLLKTGSPEMVSMILENISFGRAYSSTSDDDFSGFALDEENSEVTEGKPDSMLKDIMDAFAVDKIPKNDADAAGKSDNPADPREKPVTVNDMMDAFGVVPATRVDTVEQSSTESPGDLSEVSMNSFYQTVELCMENGTSAEIRFRAAVLLAGQGRKNALTVLLNLLPTCSASQRIDIAECLENSTAKDESLMILRELVKDGSENVRHAAVGTLISGKPASGHIDVIFTELMRKDSPLKPHDVLKKSSLSGFNKRNSGKWILKILGSSDCDAPLQTLALIILQKCWTSGDEKLLGKFMESEIPWQRRAAYYTLGKCSISEFKKHGPEVIADSSEHVRIVFPTVFMKNPSNWIMYIDENRFAPSYDWYSSSSRNKPALPPDIKNDIMKLTLDPSANVRLEAFFCLLSGRESFDIKKFIETVDSLPERESVQNRISEFLNENYKQLGQNFKFLVPYLERSRRMNDQQKDKIYKHFNVNPSSLPDDEPAIAGSDGTQKAVQATFIPVKDDETQPLVPCELKLVYFTNPGCQDCARVDKMLRDVAAVFPSLSIDTRNIRKQEAMRFNEALCEQFGVAPENRLVSPAIFCGAGYLIKKDIVFERVCGLISRSETVPLGEWYQIPSDDLEKAGESIRKRFSIMSLGIVSVAGLLDGVNPCAFATIIFLLSYLQLTKRSSSQIAQVGIAFILGVFIAYFCLGLGLVEIVTRLASLRSLGKILNWGLAAFSLVIMVLSIRDGVLCLKGNLKDISLQLPDFLKTGIHAVIRKGARHSHFVIAAFIVGIVISFLELACTGQVYAPTIMYMVQESGMTGKALAFMIIYNLAFILPLVIIFIMSYLGMKSSSLAVFMGKHAAAVKFCTALLFLIIFLAFVFGDMILPSQDIFLKK
ncbi:MAG: hypothetical protein A2X45_18125 [Lentisphaerae bacterium GWF2_50_93]|nr:MAG: hypothetical protein A2X45_18125 [Lentisphaerae bacterium GWF2_50_93]